MPPGQIDPARLEGEELRRWYDRNPEEQRLERDAVAARRDAEFYGHSSSPGEAGSRYGALYAPPPDDLAELRRQQAAFDHERRAISKQNSWMAIPALAPAVAVLGLEAAAAIASGLAAPAVARGPLVLTERMPYLRVGDNWATRAGRRAHQALKARVDAKPGWKGEHTVGTDGGSVRLDVKAPIRPSRPDKPYQMELKPNTPTGRRAGKKAVERYERETGNKTRDIYYNPKDYM